jgi:hypothetical protein
MATMVLAGELTTDATTETAARLLGEAWRRNKVRGRIGDVEEPTPGSYRMAMMGNLLDVSVASAGTGTRISARVLRTRTTQDRFLMLIPLGPKKVHANDLMKGLLERHLADSLRKSGFTASFTAHKIPL